MLEVEKYCKLCFVKKKQKKNLKKKHLNFLYIILFAGYLRMNLSSVQTDVAYKSFLYNDMKWVFMGTVIFHVLIVIPLIVFLKISPVVSNC